MEDGGLCSWVGGLRGPRGRPLPLSAGGAVLGPEVGGGQRPLCQPLHPWKSGVTASAQ